MASVWSRISPLLSWNRLSTRAIASPCNKPLHRGVWRRAGVSWLQLSALRGLGSSAVALQGEPSGVNEESSSVLTLSDSCVKELLRVNKEEPDLLLRITIDGGGCSGFQYQFEFATEVKADDRVFERDGARVVVDDLSLTFLGGCIVDYHEELIRSSFRVVDNPNADIACSCGTSFAPK